MAKYNLLESRNVFVNHSQSIQWRTLDELQKLGVLPNFLSRWVREILVRDVTDDHGMEKRVLIAKVCTVVS